MHKSAQIIHIITAILMIMICRKSPSILTDVNYVILITDLLMRANFAYYN